MPNGQPPTLSLSPVEAAQQITRGHHVWGSIGAPATVTYAFRNTIPLGYQSTVEHNEGASFVALSAQQQTAVETALRLWADVAQVSFTRVSSVGNPLSDNASMLFGTYNSTIDHSSAFAQFAGNTDPAAADGDVWLNRNSFGQAGGQPPIGDLSFEIILHEIGHALGLEHPGPYNAGAVQPTYLNNAVCIEDTRQYTLMSYFDNQGAAEAPLLHDIAAIQRLYGANLNTRLGATTYGFHSNVTSTAAGVSDVYNFSINAAPNIAIWDAGGIDTLDLSGYSLRSTIDLTPGAFITANGQSRSIALAVAVDAGGRLEGTLNFNPFTIVNYIENAIGGSGRDVIYGNARGNILTGNGGADILWGRGGFDTLIGGPGDDRYTLADGNAPVNQFGLTRYDSVIESVNGGTDTVSVAAVPTVGGLPGTYTTGYVLRANVENGSIVGTRDFDLDGNSLENVLEGNSRVNVLSGFGGRDTLIGGLGADTLDGGDDIDTASYATATSAANVFLNAQNLNNGAAAGDTLIDIENLTGSKFGDILSGDGNANVLRGGLGNDFINGGGGVDFEYGDIGDDVLATGTGVDHMDGGVGLDTASYELFGSGVRVNLANSLLNTGVAAGDTYISIENIRGSGGADDLTGDGAANVIDGGAGADRMLGGSGNDQLIGGAGGDVLYGGIGADTLIGGTGNDAYVVDELIDTVIESSALATEIDTVQATVSYTLTANVEVLSIGGFAALNGTGNTLANSIFGNSAANVINGLGGNDTLRGDLGADTFVFNSALNARTNVDTISDFTAADDTIQLENTGAGRFNVLTSLGGLAAAFFKANATGTATDADDHIIYNTTTGALFYDLNGNLAGGATQFATLTEHPTISNVDFVVI